MKTNDDFIKKTLKFNMQHIDDEMFTKNIINKHLANRKITKSKPFVNFLPIIIGLSSVLISIGIAFVARQKYDWIAGTGLSEIHGLILLMISIICLLYKSVEEFTNIINKPSDLFLR